MTVRGTRNLEDTKRGDGNLEETERGDLEVTLYNSDDLDNIEDSRNSLEDLNDNIEDSRDHTGDMRIPQDPSTTCVNDCPKGRTTRSATEEINLQREIAAVAAKKEITKRFLDLTKNNTKDKRLTMVSLTYS